MRFVRLLLHVVVIVVTCLILSSYPTGNDKILGVVGCFGVSLVHFICWDLLDFGFLDNFLGKFIKRIVFYGVFFFAVYLSVVMAKEHIQTFETITITGPTPEIFLCGSVLGTVAVGLLCYGSSLSGWNKNIGPFIGLIGLLFILGGGFIVSILVIASRFFANLINWAIVIGGAIYFLMLHKANGLIYKYREGTTSSGGGRRGYSPSYSAPRSSSGNPYNDLSYYMSSIASDNCRTRGCSYGVTARSRVSQSLYGDDATFTVDIIVDLTVCSATNQNEMSWVTSDVQKFQKEVMRDVYNEASSLIRRLASKYSDFNGVNLSVNPGDISEY